MFLAIDMGTTMVAISTPLISLSSLNLQYAQFGHDTIKRVQNGLDESSAKRLQEKAIDTINSLINEASEKTGLALNQQITDIAIAGNTAMEMALCGYPLISLAKPPYRPLSEVYFPDKAGALPGLLCPPNAKLFIFPILDGFVGGDAFASIYYLDMINSDKPIFLADFGTNVEIAIGGREKIYTASAPAGPAFEGGNIGSGMAASEGAISGVSLKNGKFQFEIIGGGTNISGICGSGIMSLVGALLSEKIIDKNGRILPPEEIESESFSVVSASNVRFSSKGFEDNDYGNRHGYAANDILLHFDGKSKIRFSQEDMRQFQFAKSAVKSTSEILLQKYKIDPEDDFSVYLSGSFGSRIDPNIIDTIDIFPFKNKKINFIKDSALSGCEKYLTALPSESDSGSKSESESKCGSERERDIARIKSISKNFPLSGSKLFQNLFIKNTAF